MYTRFLNKKVLAIAFIIIFIAGFSGCRRTEENDSSMEENTSEMPELSIDLSSMEESGSKIQTASPVIIQHRTVSDGRVVFSGTCEEGAEIFVSEDEKVITTTKSYYGSYIFELTITSYQSPMKVSVYAKSEGKALSEPAVIEAYYKTDDEGIAEWVWVGKDFHLFFTSTKDNYYRNDILTSNEEEAVKQIFSERAAWLNESLGAKPIYVLVPNPNEIYSEYMPDTAAERPDMFSLHDQTVNLLTESGAVVIDMKPILEEHKNDEFEIYHKTDSHWTEYASFFAYTELFNYIAKRFPASAPRPIEDFCFANDRRHAGDLYTDLDMDETILYETSTFANINFDTPVDIPKYKNNESILIADEPTKEHTFSNPESEDRPNVIILRDSYSIMMFDFIAERCAATTMRAMWDFTFDRELFKNLDVDYVIYIVCDMNLKNLYK